jgi:hypothetical protein
MVQVEATWSKSEVTSATFRGYMWGSKYHKLYTNLHLEAICEDISTTNHIQMLLYYYLYFFLIQILHFRYSNMTWKTYLSKYFLIKVLMLNLSCRSKKVWTLNLSCRSNYIGSVMVSVFVLNMVVRGFRSWSEQTKDYKNGICCITAIKHITLRSKKSKDGLA